MKPIRKNVRKLSCFIGIITVTALTVLTEVGDFKRFSSARHFASYIGPTPGEDSSGDDRNHIGITKAGSRHIRSLLVEATQSYSRGQIGFKPKALKVRQDRNPPEVIAYVDKAIELLRRKYCRMVLKTKIYQCGKNCCCQGTCLLHVGHVDKQRGTRYHIVLSVSRPAAYSGASQP